MCICNEGGSNKDECKLARPDGETTIPWLLPHSATKNGHWKGALGRLHPGHFFSTITTEPLPMKSEGRLLHHTEDRFITIRELARAQTMPDSFQFSADRKAALKQVRVHQL